MGPRKLALRQSITEQGNMGREGFRELSLVQYVRRLESETQGRSGFLGTAAQLRAEAIEMKWRGLGRG